MYMSNFIGTIISLFVIIHFISGLMVSSHLKKQVKASEALKVQLPKHVWELIGFIQPVLGLLAFYILNGSKLLDRD